MQIQTIRVAADPSADNPLGFITINLPDFDPERHTPYDDEARAALAGAMTSGQLIPSAAELLAARDQLQARQNMLDEQSLAQDQREGQLAERERAVAEREAANEAEAQRLALLAAQSAAPAVSPEIAAMSKDQLQAALTEKGIAFPAAANKADLVALLTAAPAA